jgi:hypothetical protein
VALDPNLRIGLADPRTNVYPNLDTITLAELAAALDGLGVSTILYDTRVTFGTGGAGINDGDNINTPLAGVGRGATLFAAGQAANTVFQLLAGGTSAQLNVRDGRRTMHTLNIAGSNGVWVWRPFLNAQNPLSFSSAFLPTTGTPNGEALGTADPSVSIEGYVRKLNAGDGSDCQWFFGFVYNRITTPTRCIVRIGLLGDGVGGYRFGSVNAPDGAGPPVVANNATDIDAGSVQPAQLVAPGVLWSKVKIKLIPPTPTQTGRWAAYLNDQLVKVFNQVANLPRGYMDAGGNVFDDGYRAIEWGSGATPTGSG